MPTEQRVRRGLGHVPQEQAIFGGLTVKENLLVGAMAERQGDRSASTRCVELFPRLGQRMSQQAGTLSGGERKMLAISRALLGRPLPAHAGRADRGRLARGGRGDRRSAWSSWPQSIAVVIVEQHVELALRVSQYCYVMDRGRIALEGPSERSARRPQPDPPARALKRLRQIATAAQSNA